MSEYMYTNVCPCGKTEKYRHFSPWHCQSVLILWHFDCSLDFFNFSLRGTNIHPKKPTGSKRSRAICCFLMRNEIITENEKKVNILITFQFYQLLFLFLTNLYVWTQGSQNVPAISSATSGWAPSTNLSKIKIEVGKTEKVSRKQTEH
jgi:hypothetical protein